MIIDIKNKTNKQTKTKTTKQQQQQQKTLPLVAPKRQHIVSNDDFFVPYSDSRFNIPTNVINTETASFFI